MLVTILTVRTDHMSGSTTVYARSNSIDNVKAIRM